MVATLIGLLGIVANGIIYQQKSRKGLLLWKLISDVLWAVHYALLGAWSGVAVAVVGMARETVFYRNRNRSNGPVSLVVFIGIALASAAITWKSLYSLLPAAASVISVISFWKATPSISKKLAFPISGCMLTYDISAGSFSGIANECLTLTSALVGLVREQIARRRAKADEVSGKD